MADRIDHVAWADAFIQDAESPFDPNVAGQPDRDATVAENLAFAQVHATLALVEAQRTANLIAYVQLLETQYATAKYDEDSFDWSTHQASLDRHTAALALIREGLGL